MIALDLSPVFYYEGISEGVWLIFDKNEMGVDAITDSLLRRDNGTFVAQFDGLCLNCF